VHGSKHAIDSKLNRKHAIKHSGALIKLRTPVNHTHFGMLTDILLCKREYATHETMCINQYTVSRLATLQIQIAAWWLDTLTNLVVIVPTLVSAFLFCVGLSSLRRV
jgi:hypothetical protein